MVIIQNNNNSNERKIIIRKLIQSDHMTSDEKRESTLKICEKYSEIFHLEGDKLTYVTKFEYR